MSKAPMSSDDYQKGLDAAKQGDYATVLKEFKPLAERGDASAQNYLGEIYIHGLGSKPNQYIGNELVL